MSRDGLNPIRRAAGVIMWHIERSGDEIGAVAKATAREPGLTEAEMDLALRWARAALSFRDCAFRAVGKIAIVIGADGKFSVDESKLAMPGLTIEQLVERCGLASVWEEIRALRDFNSI